MNNKMRKANGFHPIIKRKHDRLLAMADFCITICYTRLLVFNRNNSPETMNNRYFSLVRKKNRKKQVQLSRVSWAKLTLKMKIGSTGAVALALP